ncbi:MAG: MBL fold metallo-hydrolase [Thermoplasmata archaeon]
MSRPTLRFLGGVHEIGGNKIVIDDGAERILFDFGPSFSPAYDDFYYKFLQPRSTSPVKDLLEFDLLPRVEGLYSREALAGSDVPYVPPEFHAIFVSHAHADHAAHLDLVDPDIPVYVSPGTKTLLEAIESSSGQRYGTHPWQLLTERRGVRIGDLEVVPFPVDHSIPSAQGFLIRTSEGAVAYTGDFRMHGPRSADTLGFVEEASQDGPRALIIEGTRAGPDPRRNLSEAGVQSGVEEVLRASAQVGIVSCYPRDIDRLTTLYQAARAAEREFVVSLRTAHVLTMLDQAKTLPGAPVPGRSEGLKVYVRSKKTYYRWERPFLDAAVDADYVRTQGPRVLLALDLAHFAELIDVRPPRGAPFIHSMSEPFSEVDVDDKVLHNWLDHFGLAFHQMHASGHCSGAELDDVIRRMGARAVFPVHTEHPEAFRSETSEVIPPVLGTRHALPL